MVFVIFRESVESNEHNDVLWRKLEKMVGDKLIEGISVYFPNRHSG